MDLQQSIVCMIGLVAAKPRLAVCNTPFAQPTLEVVASVLIAPVVLKVAAEELATNSPVIAIALRLHRVRVTLISSFSHCHSVIRLSQIIVIHCITIILAAA